MNRPAEHVVKPLLEWFRQNARQMPWRKTTDPYAIWVSEIMLQQTQVATVIPYWERWMSRFPNVESLAQAPADDVLKLWEGLGYYSRARNLQKAAEVIVGEFAGRFPARIESLLDLPGVGPYTAGAISSIAFNQPEAIVDGNVVRLITRLLGIEGPVKSKLVRQELWETAGRWVKLAKETNQENACSHFNQGMMELGALVCLPANPRCGVCPLNGACAARHAGSILRIPNLGERPQMIREHRVAWILRLHGFTILRKRLEIEENAGFWEFPNAGKEVDGDATHWSAVFPPAEGTQTLKHSIMNRRITLEGRIVSLPQADFLTLLNRIPGSKKTAWEELDGLPMVSSHRKLLKRFEAVVLPSA